MLVMEMCRPCSQSISKHRQDVDGVGQLLNMSTVKNPSIHYFFYKM